MTDNYHVPIPEGAAANADTFNDPLGQLDEALTDLALTEKDGHIIQDEDVDLPQQQRLNFIGSGVTATNNPGNGSTDVTIEGPHVIQEEGSPLTQQPNLNFVGPGIKAENDAGNDATKVTVDGSNWGVDIRTLSGTLVLADTDDPIQVLDPGGANRVVTLPAAGAANHRFIIINTDPTYTIDVQKAGAVSLFTLEDETAREAIPDKSADWYASGGGAAAADTSTESYTFAASIATSDLTVALKLYDGTDPSVGTPLKIPVGSGILEITSALSVTVTDTMADIFSWDSGKIQGNDAQLFVYIINNNGTPQLGISPSPSLRTVATNYFDIGAGSQTGSAGHNNIVMSGTRHATNSCRVLGRINAKQSDANAWQTPTTALIINFPIWNTDWLIWTPQHSRAGGAYTNLPTQNAAYYTLDRERLYYTETHTQHGTPGSSGAQRFTGPIRAHRGNTGNGLNASTLAGMGPFISDVSYTISLYKMSDGSAECTASNVYQVSGFYQLAP
jgi:hypothetical protein